MERTGGKDGQRETKLIDMVGRARDEERLDENNAVPGEGVK